MLVAALILAVTRAWRSSVRVGLDLLTAAGLLRLGGSHSYQALAVAAAVVVIRQLASRGLSQGGLWERQEA